MANFQQQLQRSNQIIPDIVSNMLFDYIRSISKELIDLNREQIKKDSQDIYGNAIGFYSAATDFITQGKKGEGEPFTGDDTGSFLKSFYMTVYDNVFYFGATDPKTDDILSSPNWLSQDLFGLTESNLNEVIENKFKPFLITYYRKSLAL